MVAELAAPEVALDRVERGNLAIEFALLFQGKNKRLEINHEFLR
jgi:hypothetical protein